MSVNTYTPKTWRTIKIRSQIVEDVKKLISNTTVRNAKPKYDSVADFVEWSVIKGLEEEQQRKQRGVVITN